MVKISIFNTEKLLKLFNGKKYIVNTFSNIKAEFDE